MRIRYQALLLALPLLIMSGMAVTVSAAEEASKESQQPPAQHRHGRGPKMLEMGIPDGATVTVWQPDLVTRQLDAQHGHVVIPKSGMDNYHAVVAEKDTGEVKQAIIRYEYQRGKPSGHSTRELTAVQKTDFEIVPDPVPREHRDYQSGETWSFILRFKGNPVSDIPVTLKTAYGNTVSGTSDKSGKVALQIPDDFPDIQPGERDERSALFDVTAEYETAGVTYKTRLNSEYQVNPAHWQSLMLGIVVAGFGMAAGGFIGRVGRKKNKKVRS